MAITFELVVNFGSDERAARAAGDVVRSAAGIAVGRRRIGLHEPLLHPVRGSDGATYWELSVLPVGVGWGVAVDRGRETVRLTAAELTDVGHGLFEILRGLTGYQAAQVGWDPEWQIDLAGLGADWSAELAEGDPTFSGLVLAETVLTHLRGPSFVRFALGLSWIPYEGERASTLTADPARGVDVPPVL